MKANTILGIDSKHFGNTLEAAGCFRLCGGDSVGDSISGNLGLGVTDIDGVHMMHNAEEEEGGGGNLHG
jgi:hypothetical protein